MMIMMMTIMMTSLHQSDWFDDYLIAAEILILYLGSN